MRYMDDIVYFMIESYKNWSDEPMDGDEVEQMIKLVRKKANLIEWNITQDEYDESMW